MTTLGKCDKMCSKCLITYLTQMMQHVLQIYFRPYRVERGVCPRYSMWEGDGICHGQYKRDICNLGLLDLPKLKSGYASTCLVANKFDLDVDPLAVSCWTQHILRGESLKSY